MLACCRSLGAALSSMPLLLLSGPALPQVIWFQLPRQLLGEKGMVDTPQKKRSVLGIFVWLMCAVSETHLADQRTLVTKYVSSIVVWHTPL